MYKVETKNGLLLESSSIRDIMQELARYEHDTPIKFIYEADNRKVESRDVREFYSLITENEKERKQESRK